MPTVFPLTLSPPVRHALIYATVIADFGDGYEQRANKNQAYSRADGKGAISSYKGRNRFTIHLDGIKHANGDASQEANQLWAFYQARLGGYESFYFYNPAEAAIDLSGISAIGRYLVRFLDNELAREQFFNKLFRAGISLIEVRA
jgi:phage-related protein